MSLHSAGEVLFGSTDATTERRTSTTAYGVDVKARASSQSSASDRGAGSSTREKSVQRRRAVGTERTGVKKGKGEKDFAKRIRTAQRERKRGKERGGKHPWPVPPSPFLPYSSVRSLPIYSLPSLLPQHTSLAPFFPSPLSTTIEVRSPRRCVVDAWQVLYVPVPPLHSLAVGMPWES
ncbi:hypothetical protein MRX96_008031 [Rhipicephalus microplus]